MEKSHQAPACTTAERSACRVHGGDGPRVCRTGIHVSVAHYAKRRFVRGVLRAFLEGDLELSLRERLLEVADHRPVKTLAAGAAIRSL